MMTIRIPDGRSVPIRNYVEAWQRIRLADPERTMQGWDHFPMPAGRILHEMRRGLHTRINRHIPDFGIGRKWSETWQLEMQRAARELNTPRLRIYQLPKSLAERFAHRLADRSEA